MNSDPRCCGTGTCIINAEGICWCGQVWDGEKMSTPTALREHRFEKQQDKNNSFRNPSDCGDLNAHKLD